MKGSGAVLVMTDSGVSRATHSATGHLSVVIAGGGTGGHLYPGIAVARELLARRPAATVTFAGTARGSRRASCRAKGSRSM